MSYMRSLSIGRVKNPRLCVLDQTMIKRNPSHSGYNATCRPSAVAGNLRFRILSGIKIRAEIMRVEVIGNMVRSSRRMLLMRRR
jgi:hypothetical protein